MQYKKDNGMKLVLDVDMIFKNGLMDQYIKEIG